MKLTLSITRLRQMADVGAYAVRKHDLLEAASDLEFLQAELETTRALSKALVATLFRCAAVLRRQVNGISVSDAEVYDAFNEAKTVLNRQAVLTLAAKAIGEELHKANFTEPAKQTCNVCGCPLNCDAEYASGMCMAHANEGFLKL